MLHHPLSALTRALLIALVPTAACVVEVGPEPESVTDAEVASGDDVHGLVNQPATTTRQLVRVKSGAGPVAQARVASRDAAGRPIDVGVTNAAGEVRVRTVTNGLVVAAAPGHAAGARVGAGDVQLVSLSAPERLVPRLKDNQVVLEVVRTDGAVTSTTPRAAGLKAAPASTAVPAARFRDVAGHPLADHVEALASRGVIAGDPDGRFRPNDPLTRAELIALVLRATGIPDDPAVQQAFTDVELGSWYAAPIATARGLNIVTGDPDGRFRPRDSVTRAELAAVLVRAGSVPLVDGAPPQDVPANHWARAVVATALSFCRLLDVDARGSARPDAPATRAEAAAGVSRLLSCAADRQVGVGTLLARRAAEGAWDTHSRHHTLRRETGFGTHYGDASDFHKLTLAEKRAYVASRARAGTTPLDPAAMTRSSCIEYAMELTGLGYAGVGRDQAWEGIDDKARDDGLAGTKLAADLVKAGWRAIYVNSDTRWSGGSQADNEHTYSLAVARSSQAYYDVPLSGAFLDWENDRRKSAAMDDLLFGVIVLRGGTHVAAIADGAIHELARGEGPDSHVLYNDIWSGIIDVYANQVHGGGEEGLRRARAMWTSGVLLVPPGVELEGVEGL